MAEASDPPAMAGIDLVAEPCASSWSNQGSALSTKKRKRKKRKRREMKEAFRIGADQDGEEWLDGSAEEGRQEPTQLVEPLVATALSPQAKRQRASVSEFVRNEQLDIREALKAVKLLSRAAARGDDGSDDLKVFPGYAGDGPAYGLEDMHRMQQEPENQSAAQEIASVPSNERGIKQFWLFDPNRPLDHLGTPLSDEALEVAREYWTYQHEYDFTPFGAFEALEGPRPAVDPLLRMAQARRTYTKLVMGLDQLAPGCRTYEPPYIEAMPKDLPAEEVKPGDVADGPETGPPLCPEQEAILQLAISGQNFFYTGSAGCGKSTTLHALVRSLRAQGKTVHVLAPTGQAALAVGGTTTWSFAGWTPDHHKYKLSTLERYATGKKTSKRFRKTDVIIIDEISMVENLHFERLNAVLKAGRGDDRPFGGVQIIVTGDFCQLPPVKPFEHCITCGSELLRDDTETLFTCPRRCSGSPYSHVDKWAFRSKAWEECKFAHVHLETIHRQKDANFVKILQKCRLGYAFSPDDLTLLMEPRAIRTSATRLFPTRDQVRETNKMQFERLATECYPYACRDNFFWRSEEHPHLEHKGLRNADGSLRALDDHRFEQHLRLKKAMRVVLLVNLDLGIGLCNGSQGIICGFAEYDPEQLPRKRGKMELFLKDVGDGGGIGLKSTYSTLMEKEIREFAEHLPKTSRFWPIVRFNNGVTMPIYPNCQVSELGDKQPYSLLCRTQIPLTAAWALTIHRSQGMTLDRVVVDLNRSWEDGQVYVALSRARSLDGLRVDGTSQGLTGAVMADAQVKRFFREKFPRVMERIERAIQED